MAKSERKADSEKTLEIPRPGQNELITIQYCAAANRSGKQAVIDQMRVQEEIELAKALVQQKPYNGAAVSVVTTETDPVKKRILELTCAEQLLFNATGSRFRSGGINTIDNVIRFREQVSEARFELEQKLKAAIAPAKK